MEHPIKMDDLGGKPTIFGNIHITSRALLLQAEKIGKSCLTPDAVIGTQPSMASEGFLYRPGTRNSHPFKQMVLGGSGYLVTGYM